MDNRSNSVPQMYWIDLGTFLVALLICSSPKVLELCDGDSVKVLCTYDQGRALGNHMHMGLHIWGC
jgi:hypothetical protein